MTANSHFIGGYGGGLNDLGVDVNERMTNIVINLDGGDGLHLRGSTACPECRKRERSILMTRINKSRVKKT